MPLNWTKRQRTLFIGWLLGCMTQGAMTLYQQDSYGGLEGYIAYLRRHWWNTSQWLWLGIWAIFMITFGVLFFRKKT